MRRHQIDQLDIRRINMQDPIHSNHSFSVTVVDEGIHWSVACPVERFSNFGNTLHQPRDAYGTCVPIYTSLEAASI